MYSRMFQCFFSLQAQRFSVSGSLSAWYTVSPAFHSLKMTWVAGLGGAVVAALARPRSAAGLEAATKQ